jgi:hypothetical protein
MDNWLTLTSYKSDATDKVSQPDNHLKCTGIQTPTFCT